MLCVCLGNKTLGYRTQYSARLLANPKRRPMRAESRKWTVNTAKKRGPVMDLSMTCYLLILNAADTPSQVDVAQLELKAACINVGVSYHSFVWTGRAL